MAVSVGEAQAILFAALQSGAGRARLDAETGNAAELLALTALTGSAVELGTETILLIERAVADMPLLATGLLGLAADDTYDDLVTALTPA